MAKPAEPSRGANPASKSGAAKMDAAADVIAKLTPHVEPPPMSRPMMAPPYAYPIPFGAPPEEPVKLVDGEIPWELRED